MMWVRFVHIWHGGVLPHRKGLGGALVVSLGYPMVDVSSDLYNSFLTLGWWTGGWGSFCVQLEKAQ